MFEQDGVIGLPICHYRMEFALFVHDVIREMRPDALAIEYPASVKQGFITGVARLPYLSILIYPSRSQENIYLPIEPCDAGVEAVRSARELEIPLYFIDLDIDDPPTHLDRVPDSYALVGMEPSKFYKAWYEEFGRHLKKNEADLRREQYMAYRLQELRKKHDKVLLVCGMAHLQGIQERLRSPQILPMGFFRRQNAKVFNLGRESSRSCLAEFGFLSAAYETYRGKDRMHPGVDSSQKLSIRELQKGGLNLRVISGGLKQTSDLEAHVRQILRVSGESLEAKKPGWIDRKAVLELFFSEAGKSYERKFQEDVKLWQIRAMREFLHKYCCLEQRLMPDFFQMVNAGKGVIDDDFAYELWELGTTYPYQEEKPSLMTVEVGPQEVWLGSEKIRFRPRIAERKMRRLGIPSRLRPRDKEGNWDQEFSAGTLCSYPVEDIAIEGFGETLKQKGAQILSMEHSRVEPFTVSLLDGIDYKETIRNFGEQKIFVRELRSFEGQIGSVILIFDEDRENEKYNYRLTWLGEHEQESDLAFYATDFQDQLIGPGMGRSLYGGLMMTYPPGRLFDVWTDPNYVFIKHKHEVLLTAGIEYSVKRNIVYVGPRPPRAVFKTLAARMGRKLIYLPLGSFSPHTLKRIRRFHVLSGHEKRNTIKDYL
jgi:hypothetical protein